MTDLVNRPSHYTTQGPVECIEITEYMTSPNLAAAFQYVWRCDHKGTREQDLHKAWWYLNRELNRTGFTLNPPSSMRGASKFNEWCDFTEAVPLNPDERTRVAALRNIWMADYRRADHYLEDAIMDIRDMLP